MMNEVVIHNNDRIHHLLCGKQQRIGAQTNKRRLANQVTKPGQSGPDFSEYPFPAPIEPRKSALSLEHTGERSQRTSVESLTKLRQSESDLRHIEEYLQVYEANQHRKARILHHDLEEHYLQPLARKLEKKITGPRYKDFCERKQRAISAFEMRARANDTFFERMPEIPTLTMRTGDLTDPVMKYRRNAEREAKLSEIIAKNTGDYREPREFPDRDTLNLKKWTMLEQTRFYNDGGDIPVAHGRRAFPENGRSSVSGQIDQFQPPARVMTATRPVPTSAIDHIHFHEE